MMVPVDMRGIEDEFNDVEEMVTKLGPEGAASAFLKARDYFEKNKPEGDECAQPMTAKEWSKVLEEDAMEDMEEEMYPEGEEEDILEEPEEEDGEGDDEEAAEPAAKKAKTD